MADQSFLAVLQRLGCADGIRYCCTPFYLLPFDLVSARSTNLTPPLPDDRAQGSDKDGAFWRTVHAHGHRSGRQPAGDFSGERVPAFADGALVDAAMQASPPAAAATAFQVEQQRDGE
jgi:hypothetical protein